MGYSTGDVEQAKKGIICGSETPVRSPVEEYRCWWSLEFNLDNAYPCLPAARRRHHR